MILVTWQRAGEPEPKVMHTGVYEEEFRKTGEGWKLGIHIRKVHPHRPFFAREPFHRGTDLRSQPFCTSQLLR